MKNPVSPRDIELLSAFLDRELSKGERLRLQTRLEESAELRAALEGLRQTRTIVRNLPQVRAPRNFILTPQLVGIRPARKFYPVLGFVSAMASFLLVLALVSDFTGVITQFTSPMRAAQEQPAEVAMQEMEQRVEMEAIVEEAEVTALDSAGEATPETTEVVTALGVIEETPEAALMPGAPQMSITDTLMPKSLAELPPMPPADLSTEPVLLVEPTATSEPTQEVAPGVLQLEAISPTPLLETPAAQEILPGAAPYETLATPPWFSWLRATEVVLAVIALSTGLAAVFAWRRARV